MAKYIGARLARLPVDRRVYMAVGGEARNPENPQFTDHYFTGDYPTRLADKEGEKMAARSRSWPATAETWSIRPEPAAVGGLDMHAGRGREEHMTVDLKGRIALVTGASRGIG